MKTKKLFLTLIVTICLLILAILTFLIIKNFEKPIHYEVKTEDVKLIDANEGVTTNDDLDYNIIKLVKSKHEYDTFIKENDIEEISSDLDFNKYNYAYIKVTKKDNNQSIKLLEYIDDIKCEKIILKFQANYDDNLYKEITYIYEVPVSKDITSPIIEIDWEKIEDLSEPEELLMEPNGRIYSYYSEIDYNFEINGYETLGVATNFEEYKQIIEKFEIDYLDENIDFSINNYLLLVIDTKNKYNNSFIEYKGYNIIDNQIVYTIDISNTCGMLAPHIEILALPISKEYNGLENNIKFTKSKRYCDPNVAYKPVLYLYPENKTNITINFENEEYLTTTYPKFKNSWQILAYPNGDLYDYNGKYYYALYWEEKYTNLVDFSEGFYVTKDNAIQFLEEKLSIIGLSDREKNEFIMYWLPILEQNEKNLVYFELTGAKQKYNELIIEPKPDSLLRMTMHVKKVQKQQNIKEQKLETFDRTGFTAVEWGGVKY
ncbi:MAG: hypothetical protein J6B98_01030 [Bacilli bacterium]|nr:hypothetical protein [Bacilli bacterium]